jgi:hypothetical protein
MGIIKNVFDCPNIILHSDWAHINRKSGELELSDNPIKISDGNCLKNIKYCIKDGILYISGKQCFWEYLHTTNSIDDWSSEWCNKFEMIEEDLETYEIPESQILRNVILKKRYFWALFFIIPIKKTYPIVYDAKDSGWVKLRKELDFEYCLHPFKLLE